MLSDLNVITAPCEADAQLYRGRGRGRAGRVPMGTRAARRRGKGLMRDVLAAAKADHMNDPLRQVAAFMLAASRRGIPAAQGTARSLSEKRKTEIGNALMRMVKDSAAARCPIQNIDLVTLPQVVALVRFWVNTKRLSVGTINDRISSIRKYLELVGSRTVIPTREEWTDLLRQNGVDLGTRSNMAVEGKGWLHLNVDPLRVIAQVRVEHPREACHLLLFYLFGLRRKEAAAIRPRIADRGDYIVVSEGTKGGKERQVKFSSNPARATAQREALDWAKSIADHTRGGHLGVPGCSLEATLEHQRYVFRKFGITAKKLGVVPHGLRHQFACDLFMELTGWPAPVLGLMPSAHYRKNAAKVKEAMLEVSSQLGHVREQITGAYVSTMDTMGKQERIRLQKTLDALAVEADLMDEAGVDTVWIAGRAAEGLPLNPGEIISLWVRVKAGTHPDAEALNDLADSLEAQLRNPVLIAPWGRAEVPPDCVEVLFTTEEGDADED